MQHTDVGSVEFQKADVGKVVLEDLAEGLSVVGASDGAVLTESDTVSPAAADQLPFADCTVGIALFLNDEEAAGEVIE